MQSFALRNMLFMMPNPEDTTAQIICAEMMLGGFGWIPNLVEVDHSYILPVALGILNLTIVEVNFKNLTFFNFKILTEIF
jgi:inner membrane protein COX18